MSDRPRPPAFEDLRAQLVAAAERDNAAAQRERVPWWRRLRIPVIAAVVGLTAASAGVATYFTGSGDPLPKEAAVRGGSPSEPGVLADSAAPDPIQAAPAWVLRLSSNEDGRDCIELGRLKDGQFGQMTGRVFRAQPHSNALCVALNSDPLLVSVFQRREPPRTVVYGISRDRRPVTVRVGTATRTLRPGGLGAFIGVLAGTPDISDATATTTAPSGRTVTRRIG